MQQRTSSTGMTFTPKRAVTLPLFKMKPGDAPYYFRLDGAIFRAPDRTVVAREKTDRPADVMREPAKMKEPPYLIHVTKLDDPDRGRQGQIIAGAVLKSTLEDSYPGEAYVGLCFEITVSRDREKDYNFYSIVEIEPTETPDAVIGATPPAAPVPTKPNGKRKGK